MPQAVNFFWDGPTLGRVHAACIRSFQRQGHHARLHCYEPPADVPSGVEIVDARAVMPRAALLRFQHSGSVSLGSNRYRYRLIEQGYGLYADCDMVCLRPIPERPIQIGLEADGRCNGALLHFPPGSALSSFLLDATADDSYIPPFLKPKRQRIMRLRKRLGVPCRVQDQGWGTWGPRLLSYAVDHLDLWDEVAPIDRFYAIGFDQQSLLTARGLSLADLVTPRSEAIHLWNNSLTPCSIAEDTPLGEVLASLEEAPETQA